MPNARYDRRTSSKSPRLVIAVFAFTGLVLGLGYAAFGLWTSLIFSSGFLGGFLLWLMVGRTANYTAIRAPYWLTLALFAVHRVDEKLSGFFAALSGVTGVETPTIASWPVIGLVLASVGAWLLVLPLVKRGHAFGGYLAWTFFAAMGITELFHFVFPFLDGGGFRYFPGMASAALLAPAAWWGMVRLIRPARQPDKGAA